jgi:hypothetical protein
MSDNASHPLGLLGVLSEYTYSITVNDSNPVPSISGSTLSTNIPVEAKAEHNGVKDRDYELLLTTNSGSTMILGVNSSLKAIYDGVELNNTVLAVPFGLNLGHNGTWAGSLILGGSNVGASYDANRVTNSSWA